MGSSPLSGLPVVCYTTQPLLIIIQNQNRKWHRNIIVNIVPKKYSLFTALFINSLHVEGMIIMMSLLQSMGRESRGWTKTIMSYWNVALDGAWNCLLMLSCPWESYETFVVITCLQSPWCCTFIKVIGGIEAPCF